MILLLLEPIPPFLFFGNSMNVVAPQVQYSIVFQMKWNRTKWDGRVAVVGMYNSYVYLYLYRLSIGYVQYLSNIYIYMYKFISISYSFSFLIILSNSKTTRSCIITMFSRLLFVIIIIAIIIVIIMMSSSPSLQLHYRYCYRHWYCHAYCRCHYHPRRSIIIFVIVMLTGIITGKNSLVFFSHPWYWFQFFIISYFLSLFSHLLPRPL